MQFHILLILICIESPTTLVVGQISVNSEVARRGSSRRGRRVFRHDYLGSRRSGSIGIRITAGVAAVVLAGIIGARLRGRAGIVVRL